MTKSFLLLILSLMTGLASAEMKGCQKGWVEFTFNFPMHGITNIAVVQPEGTSIQSTKMNEWETTGNVSLFHDTNNKKLRVVVRELNNFGKDFGEYKCKFDKPDSSEEKSELEVDVEEKDGCPDPFNQTVYEGAKTTITCDNPRNTYKPRVKFFCKDKHFICQDILSTKSSLSKGTFTLTETNSGFNVSISDVSSQEAGVYWCGVEPKEGRYRTALRKIQLEVKNITTFSRSPTAGQNFTYWCGYPNGSPIKKFICKGEDPSICHRLASTARPNEASRFSMKDNRVTRNITITVREVTTDDTGTYWCGAESTNSGRSNPFFHRLVMTVVPPSTSAPSVISSTTHQAVDTPAVSSTPSAGVSAESDGGSWLTVTIAAVVCVAVLALVLILLVVCKRLKHSKHIRNGEAQNKKEDRTYEEIQERPQQPDSETALKTIYATASFPTNPSSASHHYFTVNFQNSSVEVSGDTYSAVRDNDQRTTSSTASHPPRCSEDPFYSTVGSPQRH